MIDFRVPGYWQELNDQVEKDLHWQGPGSLKSFWGLSQALLEVLASLQKQYPLRRKVFFFRHQDPFIDFVMRFLAREGVSLQPLTLKELHDHQDWVSKIDKEALAVVVAKDDPLFGMVHPTGALCEALKATKVFQVCVSHSLHRVRGIPKPASPTDIHLLSLSPDLCLGVFGERAKAPLIMGDSLPWGPAHAPKIVQALKPMLEDQFLIESFEAAKHGGAHPFFLNGTERLLDRAVITYDDMDGSALIEELAERMNIKLEAPGYEQRLETSSLTRWGGVRTMDWLVAQGFSEEKIRGTVIIFKELLAQTGFDQAFDASRAAILKLQG